MTAQVKHTQARGAFLALRAMGATVEDGPMFTGRVHGPWQPGTPEWAWTWESERQRAWTDAASRADDEGNEVAGAFFSLLAQPTPEERR